jgi:hypothetical protein
MSETPTVNINKRQKTYPEENFEFEGTVNGKLWTAKQKLGFSPTVYIHTNEGIQLTSSEEKAVRDAIWEY